VAYPTIPAEARTDADGWMASNVKGAVNQGTASEEAIAARRALIAAVKDNAATAGVDAPLTEVMKWGIRKAAPDVASELKESIRGSREAIIDFLRALITTGSSGQVTSLDHFYRLWQVSRNREWIKERFRDADPGMHEWIPSDLIHHVLGRAQNAVEALGETKAQAVRWVDLHHRLRSPTQYIFFTPRVDTNGAAALQGHSGAVYIAEAEGDPMPATARQNYWHAALQSTVENYSEAGTPRGLVTTLRGTVARIVWNGNLAGVPAAQYDQPFDVSRQEATVPITRGLEEPVPYVTATGEPFVLRPPEPPTGAAGAPAVSPRPGGAVAEGPTLRQVAQFARDRRAEILQFFDDIAGEF
jgi:hypothetical protein